MWWIMNKIIRELMQNSSVEAERPAPTGAGQTLTRLSIDASASC